LAGAVRRNTTAPCPPWVPPEVCALTTDCPPGYLCFGDGTVQDCPAGSFCAGGNSNNFVVDAGGRQVAVTGLCKAGAFCPARSVDSAGRVALTPLNRSLSNPHLCPPGTTNGYVGKSRIEDCTPCTLGTFGPNEGAAFPLCQGQCLPGQRGFDTGKTSPEEACKDCLPGTYASVPGQATCVPCALGSYNPWVASTNCTPCPSGFYGEKSGSSEASDCVPCPAGTYGRFEGQAVGGCQGCPAGKYGLAAGATTEESGCAPCPDGSFTAAKGSPSVASCVPMAYPCPFEREPAMPPFATRISECVNLTCPPPLRNVGGSCAGCAPGFSPNSSSAAVDAAACAPCAAAAAAAPGGLPRFCPGFVAAPLVNATFLSPACTAALLIAASARAWDMPPGLVALSGGLSGSLVQQTVAGLALVTLAVSTVAWMLLRGRSFALWKAHCKGACGAYCERGRGALREVDIFGLQSPARISEGAWPTMHRTVIGGVISLITLGCLSFLGLYYVISAMSLDNAVATSEFSIYNLDVASRLLATRAPVWLTAAGGGAGGGVFSGLRVRVLVSGDPGACAAPISWEPLPGGLLAGAWTLLDPVALPASAACPAAIANEFSLTVFSCAECLLCVRRCCFARRPAAAPLLTPQPPPSSERATRA
jgi:hypothetical protein